jgi:ATP-dependent Clp protease ATP-binding subunit ClpC
MSKRVLASVVSSFSPEIEAILVDAAAEAARRGHRYVGPEHLLLSLTAQADTTAIRALQCQGVDIVALRARLDAFIGHAEHATTFQQGLTHRLRTILRLAVIRARRQRRAVTELDLLQAILQEGENVASSVLKRFGVKLAALEAFANRR